MGIYYSGCANMLVEIFLSDKILSPKDADIFITIPLFLFFQIAGSQ